MKRLSRLLILILALSAMALVLSACQIHKHKGGEATCTASAVCDECGKRFTTYEKVETIPLIIIKKDNNRETYDRSKIEAGILRACHKRPVSAA